MKLLISVLLLVLLGLGCQARTKFVVNLDYLTLDKVLQPGRRLFVKFDVEHPHGPHQDAFRHFAKIVAESSDVDEQRVGSDEDSSKAADAYTNKRLLVGEVRIKDRQVPEDLNKNLLLLKRFKIDADELPVFGFFKESSQGSGEFNFIRHEKRRLRPSRSDMKEGPLVEHSAGSLVRWASMIANVHLHNPQLGHKDLDAPHQLMNEAVQCILEDDLGCVKHKAMAMVQHVDRERMSRGATVRSPVLGEITYFRRCLERMVSAIEENKANVKRRGAKHINVALKAMDDEEEALLELQRSLLNEQLLESVEGKLGIIHQIQFRLRNERSHLPRYDESKKRSDSSTEGDL